MSTTKWFHKPQKEIAQRLDKYIFYRLIDQVVSKDNVFEKYMIKTEEGLIILLFQIKRVDYENGYIIFEFKPN